MRWGKFKLAGAKEQLSIASALCAVVEGAYLYFKGKVKGTKRLRCQALNGFHGPKHILSHTKRETHRPPIPRGKPGELV
jgi:hypothetical protein